MMHESLGPRRSGRTRKAIEACPPNALFFVHRSGMVQYVKALAHEVGRDDLTIKAIDPKDDRPLRGLDFTKVRVDHEVWRLLPYMSPWVHEILYRNLSNMEGK